MSELLKALVRRYCHTFHSIKPQSSAKHLVIIFFFKKLITVTDLDSFLHHFEWKRVQVRHHNGGWVRDWDVIFWNRGTYRSSRHFSHWYDCVFNTGRRKNEKFTSKYNFSHNHNSLPYLDGRATISLPTQQRRAVVGAPGTVVDEASGAQGQLQRTKRNIFALPGFWLYLIRRT